MPRGNGKKKEPTIKKKSKKTEGKNKLNVSKIKKSKVDLVEDEPIATTNYSEMYGTPYGSSYNSDASSNESIDENIREEKSSENIEEYLSDDDNDNDKSQHLNIPKTQRKKTEESTIKKITTKNVKADLSNQTDSSDQSEESSEISASTLNNIKKETDLDLDLDLNLSLDSDLDINESKRRGNGNGFTKNKTNPVAISSTKSKDLPKTLTGISCGKVVNKKSSPLAHPDGYLKIVIGCMFSGKTTYIIRECKKWQSIGKNVLMINYVLDRRYTDKDQVVSHDKNSIKCLMVESCDSELDKTVELYDVILINEAQFFSDLAPTVRRWVDSLKKIVIVSGLDGNYMRGKFGDILDLVCDSDDVVKLTALCSICKDGTPAIFTWKLFDNPVDGDVLIDVGTDKYVPLCRKHYNKELKIAEMIKKQ